MAIISNTLPTFVDAAQLSDPQGGMASLAHPMAKQSPVLQAAVVLEGNKDFGHEVSQVAGLPSPSWRRANEGYDTGHAVYDQFWEIAGEVGGLSKVDVDVAETAPGGDQAYRGELDDRWGEAVANEWDRAFFYESLSANPERVHGVASRYTASSTSYLNPGYQIVKCPHVGAAASGSNQNSIWGVWFGPGLINLRYPRGATAAGISTRDLGIQLARDANGKEFDAWVTRIKLRLAICIENYRAAFRVANIDPDSWVASEKAIMRGLIRAWNRIPGNVRRKGRGVIFANAQVIEWLDEEIFTATNNTLVAQEWGGLMVPFFRGIPILQSDGLKTNSESLVA